MGQNLKQLPMDGFLRSWCLKLGFWDQGIQWTNEVLTLSSLGGGGGAVTPPPPPVGFFWQLIHIWSVRYQNRMKRSCGVHF